MAPRSEPDESRKRPFERSELLTQPDIPTWLTPAPGPRPPEGFTAFYLQHHRHLIGIAVWAGAANRQEAEDAVATVMEWFLQPDRWQMIRNPPSYARAAVVRQVWRSKRRTVPAPEPLAPDERSSAPDEVIVWEQAEWVESLLRKLPPAQRKVMRMVINGVPTGEIAANLGQSSAAVRKNLQLARTRMREILRGEGWGTGQHEEAP